MALDDSWSDWVQLNYVDLGNRRIKPVTYKFPQYIIDEWAAAERRAHLGSLVVMMSQVRRKFNDRTNRAERNS